MGSNKSGSNSSTMRYQSFVVAALMLLSTMATASADLPANCSSPAVVRVGEENALCPLCELVVGTIDFQLKFANGTVNVLEHVVADLCCAIGGEVVYDECKPMLEKIDSIVQWLTHGDDPHTVCQKLKLCDMTTADSEWSAKRKSDYTNTLELLRQITY